MKKVRPKGTHIPGFISYTIGRFNGKFGQYAIIDNEYKSRFTSKVLKNLNGYLAREVNLLSEKTKLRIQTAKKKIDRRLELEQQPKSPTDLIRNFRRDDEISRINKELAILHSEISSEILAAKEKMLENTSKYEYLLTSYYSGLSKSGFDMKSCNQKINVSEDSESNTALEIYQDSFGRYWDDMQRFIEKED